MLLSFRSFEKLHILIVVIGDNPQGLVHFGKVPYYILPTTPILHNADNLSPKLISNIV